MLLEIIRTGLLKKSEFTEIEKSRMRKYSVLNERMDGVWLVETNWKTCTIRLHESVSKGSTMFALLVRALILGAMNGQKNRRTNLLFSKFHASQICKINN